MKNAKFKPYQKPLLFDHSGLFDDLLSLSTLLTISEYQLIGVTLIDGNCCSQPSIEATLRILALFCRYDVELAVGKTSTPNPFPYEWRNKCEPINAIKLLAKQNIEAAKVAEANAEDFIAQKILEQDQKTTLVLTGPAVNVSKAIQKYPAIIDKIEKIIWVAGAFLTDGDVIAPDHDGSAEWNIYCDPAASTTLLQSGIPIYMFPLDVSKQLIIDNYLIYHFEKNKKFKLSKLAFKILEPEYDLLAKNYIKSVVAPIYLLNPDVFQFESKSIAVEQRGTSMGNIYRTSLGSRVKQAFFIDEEACADVLIKQFKQF